jgi:uncharacterized protein (TIGR00251 family)
VGRGSGWLSYDAALRRVSLTVHIQPSARRNEIVGLQGEALKIKVAAPPVDNKANAALIDFLSETLGLPKSAIAIRHGATSRRKLVQLAGDAGLAARLEALAGRSTTHHPRSTPTAASDR